MSLLDAAGVINGDIWCNGAFDFESPIKDLLESGEYTMEELLAEDELLQEMRGVHPQLIQFFSTEEAVATLVQYIILPPSTEPTTKSGDGSGEGEGSAENGSEQKNSDASKKESNETEDKNPANEEKSIGPGKWLEGGEPQEETSSKKPKSPQEEMENRYIRFPYMACEVICCEIKGIIDLLMDGTVPLLPTDDDGEEEDGKTKQISSLQISEDARGKPILDLFFSMLYTSEIGEIDDYRAGYYEKVLSILFRYRPKDIAQYLNEGGGKGNVALMSAMFKHLYSHSLMQIVQRLLLPQPPQPPNPEGDGEGKNETNECEDLFNDTLAGADMDPLDSFRCNWCESEEALKMIMESLLGEKSKPTATIQIDGDDEDERMLDLYQNASEVLITIIQNSPLTSLTMRTLTTDPNLGRLIAVAMEVDEGSEFSRHDSRLTCAMNVLESLILQLGGYGSVGTMIYEEGQGPFENVIGEPISEEQKTASDETGGTNQPQIIFATPETLIYHLPAMLSCLSNLLAYPGADDWKSPMQFSKTKAQPILGSSRLRIVRLLESLVLLGNNKIDSLLCDSSCLELCLDLFWKFQWCSMLHQSVANLLVHAFEGQNSRSELQSYFIERCNLLGRLMYSFWEKEPETNISSIISASNVELSESVRGQKDSDSENSPVSDASGEKESGTTSDVLPVSDDDVDVAMEQSIHGLQGTQSGDSTDTKVASLRLGYMGHVIIICQALVHACTEEGDAPTVDSSGIPREMVDGQGELGSHLGGNSSDRVPKQTDDSYTDDYTSAYTSTDGDTLTDALILARLVKKHPLGKIWKDFVVTTLASETALQTTPLGGFQAPALGADPLHMHRPGLEDDGAYDDDDGEAPTLPQRGLLVDGDVIDMDDNDLEVAANMMAGLNLAQVNGDSQLQSNISHQGRYVFDDPLGSGRFGDFDDDDDDEGGSSSDEEGEMIGNNRGTEAPVMDLFAGNFDAYDDTDTKEQSPSAFSDFANFDDAFADTEVTSDNQQSKDKSEFDNVFAEVKNHDILFDELDKPVSPQNGKLSDDEPASSDFEESS